MKFYYLAGPIQNSIDKVGVVLDFVYSNLSSETEGNHADVISRTNAILHK